MAGSSVLLASVGSDMAGSTLMVSFKTINLLQSFAVLWHNILSRPKCVLAACGIISFLVSMTKAKWQ